MSNKTEVDHIGLLALIDRLVEWTHQYGAAMCPPDADTYGEGVYAMKRQVACIIADGLAAIDAAAQKRCELHAKYCQLWDKLQITTDPKEKQRLAREYLLVGLELRIPAVNLDLLIRAFQEFEMVYVAYKPEDDFLDVAVIVPKYTDQVAAQIVAVRTVLTKEFRRVWILACGTTDDMPCQFAQLPKDVLGF